MTTESVKITSPELQALVDELTFGGLLKAQRQTEGLSQVAMAERLSISRQRLCDIEQGRRLPNLDSVIEIASKAGLEVIVAISLAVEEQLRKRNLPYKVRLEA